ncbi:MAG: hypothetical protein ACJ71B_05680 [Nitrososphaera sp.]
MLLLTSPLVLPDHLFQPVQAQSNVDVSFGTAGPASTANDNCLNGPATMTFDANGTASTSSGELKITSGTFNVTSSGEQTSYSGNINSGTFESNDEGGAELTFKGTVEHISTSTLNCKMIQGYTYQIFTSCSLVNTHVYIYTSYFDQSNNQFQVGQFQGVVECSPLPGEGSTQPSSSEFTTGTTTQSRDSDEDRDGISDANDRCTHNSNPRCFKEGDTSTTTHEQEQPPSTSDRTGNQTR